MAAASEEKTADGVRPGGWRDWLWPVSCLILTAAAGSLLVLVLTTFPAESRVYPTFVLGGATAVLLVLSAQSLQALRSRPPTARTGADSAGQGYRASLPVIAVFLAVWAAYAYALGAVGFVLPTWIALSVSLCVLTSTGKARVSAVAVSLPFALALFLALQVGLSVGLPMGALDVAIVDYYYSVED